MSLNNAKQWLNDHSHVIPTLNCNYQDITEVLSNPHQAHNISQFVLNDPGLQLALLQKVNENRSIQKGNIVDSSQAAISLLSDQASQDIILDNPVAEKVFATKEQIYIFHQISNRCLHLGCQMRNWAQDSGYNHLEPLKLSALLTYSGELLCCSHDFKKYREYLLNGSEENSENAIFGFTFGELTEALCQFSNLPEIISSSLPHKNPTERKHQLLLHLSTLCQGCESGWYSEFMLKTFSDLSKHLKLTPDRVSRKTHEFSVMAARTSIFEDVLQPASRLILIRDEAWKPKIAAKAHAVIESKEDQAESKKESEKDTLSQIRIMVKNHAVNQSDILHTCLKGIFDEAQMSKVSLLLLSKDKKILQSKMAIGVDHNSPFRHYQIDFAKSGLLKILLNKPQAIWINSSSLKKYHKLLPPSLMANIMTSNFLMMSLFIGPKPIGIIYADMNEKSQEITQQHFSLFKNIISLSCKALTLISKRPSQPRTK